MLPVDLNLEFFDILIEDVASFDLLQAQEKESMDNKIEELSSAITTLAKYEYILGTASCIYLSYD